MSGAIAAIAAVAVITAGVAIYEGDKNRSAANRANNDAKTMQSAQAQRDRVAAINQTRMQQANVMNQGGGSGLATSSGVQGTIGSLASTTDASIGTANQINMLGQDRMNAQTEGVNASNTASTVRAVGSSITSVVAGA